MLRVSTASTYSAMLSNLTQAQVRQNEAATQVSSEKKATDLKGYARNAEVLTAMRGVQVKVAGFLEQTSQIGGRLDMQEVAMTRMADSVTGARTAIADSLASDDAGTLMQALGGFFADAVGALNTRHDGRYLFAGGQSDTPPVNSTGLASLASPAVVGAQFDNDNMIVSNRLDENTVMDTGFLASNLGTPAFGAFKAVQDYVTTSGAFSTPLTAAQKTFLTTQLTAFDTASQGLTDATASNGLMQTRLASAREDLTGRDTALDVMVGDVTNVDKAEAITRLEQAQLSVQAAAQVFQTLQGSSLLAILSN
jgi:flagellar hook-associated protein 3 FlgL